jgi:hypothetical protein
MAKLLPDSSMSYYEDEAIPGPVKTTCHSERSEESHLSMLGNP